jgi:hypothetical protein
MFIFSLTKVEDGRWMGGELKPVMVKVHHHPAGLEGR